MIINFIQPHSLNMGENFEYISTFMKGKKVSVENYRLLVRGIKTGKEYLLALEGRPGFFGREMSYTIMPISVEEYVTPEHIQGENKRYNYYFFSKDTKTVHDFFSLWKESDPMVHIGNKSHQFLTKIKNYKGSYSFDSMTY